MTPPPIHRRTVLRGGLLLGATAATLGATGLAGCSTGPSEETLLAEALTPLARAARADEGTARRLIPAEPAYAAALTVVADQRAQHARALREEITRLDPEVANALDAPAESSVAPAPAPPPSLDRLRTDLEAALRQARDLAVTSRGYAAGLTGSISAAVTTMREVQLA